MDIFFETRGFIKLHSVAHTNSVSSATAARVIALSTCMRTAAILLVFVHAFVERDLPFAKVAGGCLMRLFSL